MKRQTDLEPHKATAMRGDDAWWYGDSGGITVYIQDTARSIILSAKISRRALKNWLARTEKDDRKTPRR